ncbi:MAG: hypothetical protein WAL47_18200 [Pyrinomonadaceae bacterium]
MKEHPDRQPRRSIPVNGGYDDDRETNDEFESERIDTSPLCSYKVIGGNYSKEGRLAPAPSE